MSSNRDLPDVYHQQLDKLRACQAIHVLDGMTRGIEKENVRVDSTGAMSLTAHPALLGSSLTHPSITTDFSESLMECVTSPCTGANGREHVFTELSHISAYVYHVLSHANAPEYLWPYSMPYLPTEQAVHDIPIAQYGHSHMARMKTLYRQGLAVRYGKAMQLISGLHYNVSFPPRLLHTLGMMPDVLHDQHLAHDEALLTQRYLGVVRNMLRYQWILPLLLGQSPVCYAASQLNEQGEAPALPYFDQQSKDISYASLGTCLRLSDIGYQVAEQSMHRLHANTIAGYAQDLLSMTFLPCERFSSIPMRNAQGHFQQISPYLLQLESELYSLVRPKQSIESTLRPASALYRHGITYLEVRCLDLNPLASEGLTRETSALIDLLLMHSLLLPSPLLSDHEQDIAHENFSHMVAYGRDPQSTIEWQGESVNAHDQLHAMLTSMQPLAQVMDQCESSSDGIYTRALNDHVKTAPIGSTLPAERLLSHWQSTDLSWQAWMMQLAGQHADYFQQQHPLSPDAIKDFETMAKDSLLRQQQLERQDDVGGVSFEQYLLRYLEQPL